MVIYDCCLYTAVLVSPVQSPGFPKTP